MKRSNKNARKRKFPFVVLSSEKKVGYDFLLGPTKINDYCGAEKSWEKEKNNFKAIKNDVMKHRRFMFTKSKTDTRGNSNRKIQWEDRPLVIHAC